MSDFPLAGAVPRDGYWHATNADGINVVGPASLNTKGSYTELIASLSHDACGFLLQGYPTGSGSDSVLMDIAIGAAGSEIVLIENIPSYVSSATGYTGFIPMYFPIFIPAGTRISARIQSSAINCDFWASITTFAAQFSNQGSFQGAETIGVNTADSGGTEIDPGATANTFGSWVELSASVGHDIVYAYINSQLRDNSIASNYQWIVQLGIGASGSEQVVASGIMFVSSSSTDSSFPPSVGFPIKIPAGSRLSVRAMCSGTDATDRLIDLSLIGVY